MVKPVVCYAELVQIGLWALLIEQRYLAGSSKTAPRIFIFSTVLGAENLSYVKSIEPHVRTFLPLDISAVGSVAIKETRIDNLFS